MSADLPTLAISVRQPWAWALIHAGKHLENRGPIAVRHMRAKKREPTALLVHASKGMTRPEYEHARVIIDRIAGASGPKCPRPDELVRGAIIGRVRWVDIISKSTSPWFFGPRALVFESPEPLQPIACVGALGLFEWQEAADVTRPLEAPKPWMISWGSESAGEGKAPRYIAPAEMPLFPEGGEQ